MSYDVQIKRQNLNALFDLKGSSGAVQNWIGDALPSLPNRPNTRANKGTTELYYIGRDHWFVRAPLEAEEMLQAQFKPADCPADISIVRVSDTMTFFSVTGPEASEIMSIACPLDLHDTVFVDHAVTYSEVFGLKALVMRCNGGFEFAVERSFGDMVEDYLARAMA